MKGYSCCVPTCTGGSVDDMHESAVAAEDKTTTTHEGRSDGKLADEETSTEAHAAEAGAGTDTIQPSGIQQADVIMDQESPAPLQQAMQEAVQSLQEAAQQQVPESTSSYARVADRVPDACDLTGEARMLLLEAMSAEMRAVRGEVQQGIRLLKVGEINVSETTCAPMVDLYVYACMNTWFMQHVDL